MMRSVQRIFILTVCVLVAMGQHAFAGIDISYPESKPYDNLAKLSHGYLNGSNGGAGTVVLTVTYKSPGGLGYFDTLGSGSGTGYYTYNITCAAPNNNGVWVTPGDYSYKVAGSIGTPPQMYSSTSFPTIL